MLWLVGGANVQWSGRNEVLRAQTSIRVSGQDVDFARNDYVKEENTNEKVV